MLPLRVMRGLVVVLVKAEPSWTVRSRLNVNVPPVSPRNGPARVTLAPSSACRTLNPAVNELLLNVTNGSVPLLVKVASSSTNIKDPEIFAGLPTVKAVFVALTTGPAKVSVVPELTLSSTERN